MPDLARGVFEGAMRRVERQERIEAAAKAAYTTYLGIARCECTGFCLRCRELLEQIGEGLKKALN